MLKYNSEMKYNSNVVLPKKILLETLWYFETLELYNFLIYKFILHISKFSSNPKWNVLLLDKLPKTLHYEHTLHYYEHTIHF